MDRDNGDLPLDLGVPNFQTTQLIQDVHPECSEVKKKSEYRFIFLRSNFLRNCLVDTWWSRVMYVAGFKY
jgi:hypothetical protein